MADDWAEPGDEQYTFWKSSDQHYGLEIFSFTQHLVNVTVGLFSYHSKHCIARYRKFLKVQKLMLTHCGRVTHTCIQIIIGSDNGMLPGRRQAIIWTNAGILLIGALGTNFSEISLKIQTLSFKQNAFENIVCEMASILSLPECVDMLKPVLDFCPEARQQCCRGTSQISQSNHNIIGKNLAPSSLPNLLMWHLLRCGNNRA